MTRGLKETGGTLVAKAGKLPKDYHQVQAGDWPPQTAPDPLLGPTSAAVDSLSPAKLDSTNDQRVYIIGHPKGGELSFSLQDNELIEHEGPPAGAPSQPERCLILYGAPTEPGDSGSPRIQ